MGRIKDLNDVVTAIHLLADATQAVGSFMDFVMPEEEELPEEKVVEAELIED